VRAGWRRQGVAQLLLERATSEAFRRGAVEVEGYPKTYGSDGNSPAAFVWTGLPRMFEAAGFTPMKAEGSSRTIYVKGRASKRCASPRGASAPPDSLPLAFAAALATALPTGAIPIAAVAVAIPTCAGTAAGWATTSTCARTTTGRAASATTCTGPAT